MQDILAVIFDYDDTIVPDSTTQLLEYHDIDIKKFWENDFKKLLKSGYDLSHAYLKLILDNIGEDKPLGKLTNKDLREFGKIVQKKQYPGLSELIADLKKITKKNFLNVEFYIISGGLEEIIKGNSFVSNNFNGIYGSLLAGNNEDSELKYIKRAITFTEKTRYLFEINKGIFPTMIKKNPMAVNREVKKENRRIPLENMIYIGDGLTDI